MKQPSFLNLVLNCFGALFLYGTLSMLVSGDYSIDTLINFVLGILFISPILKKNDN